ncbi:MAG TPA: FadR family transcriptional regulator, partial [Glaciecola sp.]|nr:FadR family transcriptional regulator [Glaciecola sp.]
MSKNLTQQLTHKLGEAIVKGDYPIGTRMPSEAVLCEQFSVSRSATREA